MEIRTFLNSLSNLQKTKEIEIGGINLLRAVLVGRVFNNLGGLATDETPLGKYSEPYLAKRIRRGKLNILKNLYFAGDLFRSIVTGQVDNKSAVGFDNKELSEIARFQEDSDLQVNRPIFTPTVEEQNLVKEYIVEALIEKLQGLNG